MPLKYLIKNIIYFEEKLPRPMASSLFAWLLQGNVHGIPIAHIHRQDIHPDSDHLLHEAEAAASGRRVEQ